MGGHLVLRALVEKRVAPEAVVLSAPMIGVADVPSEITFRQTIACAWVKSILLKASAAARDVGGIGGTSVGTTSPAAVSTSDPFSSKTSP